MRSDVTTKYTKHTKSGPYGRNQTVSCSPNSDFISGTRLFSVARVFVCLVCFVVTPSELLGLTALFSKSKTQGLKPGENVADEGLRRDVGPAPIAGNPHEKLVRGAAKTVPERNRDDIAG